MKAFAASAAACLLLALSVSGQTTYELTLTGDQNSPATNTAASASIVISFLDVAPTSVPGVPNTGAIAYNLTFSEVPLPLAAHIHVNAGPGQNGSVGVPLWMGDFAPNPASAPVSGLVASNMVTPPTFTGPLEVLPAYNNTPVSTLLSEYIETGLAYVQVHTMDAPFGFIRADFNQSAIVDGVTVTPSENVPVQTF